jgi:hypothetical protein
MVTGRSCKRGAEVRRPGGPPTGPEVGGKGAAPQAKRPLAQALARAIGNAQALRADSDGYG